MGLNHRSPLIDLHELCINENNAVWVLYADIVCLNYDGNVWDAILVSLVAALKSSNLFKK
jgi:exosome complex component RRP43